jgi:hypothetical protein
VRIILLSLLVFILSCNNEAGNKTPASFNESSSADSIELLYYKDPDGDSLRYTRFFTYLATKDSSVVNKLVRNLEQPFDKLSQVRRCRSEGKIYAHHGKAVRTVYFSTRCDSCCYLYYIRNGEFFYFKLMDELREELKQKKSVSEEVKPESTL